MVARLWREKLKRQTIYKLEQRTIARASLSSPEQSIKVFIIADSNSEPIRRLCHGLAEYGIDQIYYQYVANDREHGPGQLGIVAWTEKSFKESEMVLFVCNQGFSDIWENDQNITQDSYALIISTVKKLFHGYLAGNNFSKFAVVLLQESDKFSIPHLLRNVQHFLISNQKGLARYILQVPTHIPPGHVNSHQH